MENKISPTAITHTILEAHPNATAIYVYGSFASGDQRPDSDLDIAVLLQPQEARQATFALGDLQQALIAQTGREVDLVNLRTVNTVLQFEIVVNGERVYCADQYQADNFEAITMSLFQKLNEERAGILLDFLETKRIYPV